MASKRTKQIEILNNMIPKGFLWQELSKAIKDAGCAPKNWMSVRGLLQHAINEKMIKRTSDITVEEYAPI